MKWSKYNYLFKSPDHGPFLYNSLSNSLAEVSPEVYRQLLEVKKNPDSLDVGRHPALYLQLLQIKALIPAEEEQSFTDQMELRRRCVDYDNTSLNLTVAPTRECNFNCVYCYQHSRPPIHMTEETEGHLIDFIKRFGSLRHISVSWYGGEPLLSFDRMRSLTKKIRGLAGSFSASLVTNGYLLEKPVVDQLDDLNIRRIQITLDGPRDVHNRRRPHLENNDSFQRILRNLELLTSSWSGKCTVRVNVDGSNSEHYHELYAQLKREFGDRIAAIRPGVVFENNGSRHGLCCPFNSREEVTFYIDQYREHGIEDLGFYPDTGFSGCVATRVNSFVVGPSGSLYKCWHDIGDPSMSVGNVSDPENLSFKGLAHYAIGCDPFKDSKCVKCFYLPICGGGCPKERSEKQADVGDDGGACTYFKYQLPELLSIHYEKKCAARGRDGRSQAGSQEPATVRRRRSEVSNV